MNDRILTDSMLQQSAELAAWAAAADPARPVPSCPEWRLADLVEHVSSTQAWVAELITRQVTDPQAAFALSGVQSPTDPAEWTTRLEQTADRAAQAIAAAPAGAQVFDPSGGQDGVGFWQRRLFGEITVHRIDGALATEHPYELDPALAGIAVDDWFETVTSPGWAANVPGFADGMRGDGQTIAWVADDVDRSWWLSRGPDVPLSLIADAPATTRADVTVRGPAVDLLQLISRRRSLVDDGTGAVAGDRAELEHFLTHMRWVGA